MSTAVFEVWKGAMAQFDFVVMSYQDQYGSHSGEWQFKRRSDHVIYQGACDLSGTYQTHPEMTAPARRRGMSWRSS